MRTLPMAVTTPVTLSACCWSDSIVTSPLRGSFLEGSAAVPGLAGAADARGGEGLADRLGSASTGIVEITPMTSQEKTDPTWRGRQPSQPWEAGLDGGMGAAVNGVGNGSVRMLNVPRVRLKFGQSVGEDNLPGIDRTAGAAGVPELGSSESGGPAPRR